MRSLSPGNNRRKQKNMAWWDFINNETFCKIAGPGKVVPKKKSGLLGSSLKSQTPAEASIVRSFLTSGRVYNNIISCNADEIKALIKDTYSVRSIKYFLLSATCSTPIYLAIYWISVQMIHVYKNVYSFVTENVLLIVILISHCI